MLRAWEQSLHKAQWINYEAVLHEQILGLCSTVLSSSFLFLQSTELQLWIITTLHLVGAGCSGHHQWRQWKHREQVLAPWLTKRVSFYTLPVLVPVCFKFSF